MFNFFKKEKTVMEEMPQFRIEDNRLESSLTVYRGEKCLGHLLYRDVIGSWVFTFFSMYTHLYSEELGKISSKLKELNNEN